MCVHAKGPHELQDVNRFPVTAIIDVDHLVFFIETYPPSYPVSPSYLSGWPGCTSRNFDQW